MAAKPKPNSKASKIETDIHPKVTAEELAQIVRDSTVGNVRVTIEVEGKKRIVVIDNQKSK